MRDRSAPISQRDIAGLAWDKMAGLLPAIIQDQRSGRTLMLGYMNEEALEVSLASGRATFFSRSKKRLWTKGESSGNYLDIDAIFADCDDDALLVLATPSGPTCHTGATSCFGEDARSGPGWLADLSSIIDERATQGSERSYTRQLLAKGIGRIAQKVGEEGLEVALAAVSRSREDSSEELADLFYHATVLMHALGIGWEDVVEILRRRHNLASSETASS